VSSPLALRSRWAKTTRYQRLNFAVVGCLVVMFALVVALVATVRIVDRRAGELLAEAQHLTATAADARDASTALLTWQGGSNDARVALANARDMMNSHLAEVDTFASPDERQELQRLNDQLAKLVDASAGVAISSTTEAARLSADYEVLAQQFANRGQDVSERALGDLDGWFYGIQLVAAVAAAVFLMIVLSVILPLSRSIERSLSKLQDWRDRSARESARRLLNSQVSDGLDVADEEGKARAVLERALRVAAPDLRAELLLADSSKAHLRVAVEHPDHGRAGCGVVSPWSCPAVRRGTTMVFEDWSSIRTCPHLARHEDPCSAVCSPLTFMGEPMGVLHTTGKVGEPPSQEVVEDLSMIAAESATRLGTLRAFARAELQASTDVLTGLPNRRSTEDCIRHAIDSVSGGAIGLFEIEGLIDLNDRLGKTTGDRAIKVVAESLQFSNRDADFIGRWAGAEFVAVLADKASNEARSVIDRIRHELEESLAAADISGLVVWAGIADTRHENTVRSLLQSASDQIMAARSGLEHHVVSSASTPE